MIEARRPAAFRAYQAIVGTEVEVCAEARYGQQEPSRTRVPQTPTARPVGAEQPVAGMVETHRQTRAFMVLQRRHHEAAGDHVPQVNPEVHLAARCQQPSLRVPGHPGVPAGHLRPHLHCSLFHVQQAQGGSIANQQLRQFRVPDQPKIRWHGREVKPPYFAPGRRVVQSHTPIRIAGRALATIGTEGQDAMIVIQHGFQLGRVQIPQTGAVPLRNGTNLMQKHPLGLNCIPQYGSSTLPVPSPANCNSSWSSLRR